MRYYSTTLATNLQPADWRIKLIYSLLWFIPRSNPDFELCFSSVRRWYVEVDDSGMPLRELGLDESGVPVTAAPWARNFGFWTDSGGPLPNVSVVEMDGNEFETAWQRFVSLQAEAAQSSDSMPSRDTAIARTALIALVVSGLGYMTLAPLYETGAMRVVVPLLSVVDLAIAYAIWKRSPWVNKWLRPFAIGMLLVAVPFWGRSSEFYGPFAAAMIVVESAVVVAAACLLMLSFTPAFRARGNGG